MTNQILTEDLHKIGIAYSVDLGHAPATSQVEDIYYPQFDAKLREEAAAMAKHYEVFYCLEKAIRVLVSETIATAEKTDDWWPTARVPANIKTEVALRIQKELDAGVTRRSIDELDYTTFGELSVIITSNWDIFGGLFTSRKAVEKVMASLNSLRGPIAHLQHPSRGREGSTPVDGSGLVPADGIENPARRHFLSDGQPLEETLWVRQGGGRRRSRLRRVCCLKSSGLLPTAYRTSTHM